MTHLDPNISAEALPLSPEQSRILHLHGDAAILSARWDLRGEVPSRRVEAALAQVVARHEILRTSYVRDGQGWQQQVQPLCDIKLDTVDLRALPIDDHDDRIDTIAREMSARPFNLETAPLLRAALVRTAPGRAALLVCAHRSIVDVASFDILGRDLGAVLTADRAGRPTDLPKLALHYGDYALWQEACRQSTLHHSDLGHWADALSGLSDYHIAGDGDGGMPRIERVRLPLPPRFGARLSTAAEARGVERLALVVAAASTALSRFARSDEVVVATDVTGRAEAELAPLIGAFSNTLILRLTTPPVLSLGAHLAHIADVLNDALARSACPYADVVAVAATERDEGTLHPFTRIGVALHEEAPTAAPPGVLHLTRALAPPDPMGRALQITVSGGASGWNVLIDHDAAQHSSARMQALGTDMLAQLDAFIDAPLDEIVDLGGTAHPDHSHTPHTNRGGAHRGTAGMPRNPTWTSIPIRDGAANGPVIVTVNQPFLYRNFALCMDNRYSIVNLTVPDEAALERQRAIGYEAALDEAVEMVVTEFAGRPITFMGQCVDGMTALHLARQSEARGADVALAVLLDAWAPSLAVEHTQGVRDRLAALDHSRKRFSYYLGQLVRGNMKAHTIAMRMRPGRRLLRLLGHSVETAAGAELLIAVNRFHVAVGNLVPFPGWDGDVITFASDSQSKGILDTLFEWKGLVRPDTPIYRIAGWHEDAVQHHSYARIAEIVEARLSRCLETRQS